MNNKGCTCGICGTLYKIDLMIPDTLWHQINPENIELICSICIMSRIEQINKFGAFILQEL